MKRSLQLLTRLSLLSAALLLTACGAVKPTLVEGPTDVFQDDASQAETAEAWWRELHDDRLTALVEGALADNFSIQAAVARLDAALAGDDANRYSLLPKSSYSAQSQMSKTRYYRQENALFPSTPGPAISTNTGSFNVSWEVPFFGKGQAMLALARSQVLQAHWSVEAAKVSVATELVRSYAEWLGTRRQIVLTERQVALFATLEQGELVTSRAGASTQAEVDAWVRQRLQQQGQLRALTAQRQRLEAKMATLAGQPDLPQLRAAEGAAVPLMVPGNPTVPAGALRQRPDVRVAEAAVLSAGAELGIAKASLWPQLTLGGQLNVTRGQLDSYGTSRGSSSLISVSSGLHIPLLDWFALKAQANSKTAQLDAAVKDYRQTLLGAWEEAQTLLADYAEAGDRATLAKQSHQLAKREVERQQSMQAAGARTKMDVYRAEQQGLDREAEMAAQETAAVQAWARLVKATFVRHQLPEPKPLELPAAEGG